MKSVEDLLQDIREIESLDRHIKGHLDNMEEQQKRISFIEGQREAKQEELRDLKEKAKAKQTELTNQENTLSKVDSQLEKTMHNLSAVTTDQQLKSLENEKQKFEQQKNELEASVFKIMEDIESNQLEQKELSEFIEGSAETLHELQDEINASNQKDQKEIDQYQQRIDVILNDLAEPLLTKYKKAREKYRFKEPATYLKTDNCPKCGIAVSPSKKNDILYFKSIESCSGCGRILIPA